jgi:hypothetical protein
MTLGLAVRDAADMTDYLAAFRFAGRAMAHNRETAEGEHGFSPTCPIHS